MPCLPKVDPPISLPRTHLFSARSGYSITGSGGPFGAQCVLSKGGSAHAVVVLTYDLKRIICSSDESVDTEMAQDG